MRRLSLGLALLCLPVLAMAALKVGVVDLREVVPALRQQMSVATQPKKELTQKMMQLSQDIRKQQTEAMRPNNTPEQRDAAKKKAGEMQTQLSELRKQLISQMTKARDANRGMMREKLQAAIDSVAKNQSFDLVLPKNAVLFTPNPVDLTSAVKAAIEADKHS